MEDAVLWREKRNKAKIKGYEQMKNSIWKLQHIFGLKFLGKIPWNQFLDASGSNSSGCRGRFFARHLADDARTCARRETKLSARGGCNYAWSVCDVLTSISKMCFLTLFCDASYKPALFTAMVEVGIRNILGCFRVFIRDMIPFLYCHNLLSCIWQLFSVTPSLKTVVLGKNGLINGPITISMFDMFSTNVSFVFHPQRNTVQCSPANPAQAGEEAVGLADLSGSPSSFYVLVGD